MAGSLRAIESSHALPLSDRHSTIRPTTTTTSPPTSANHQFEMKFETLSNIRVGRGSVALKDSKKVLKRGNTNVARMTTVTIAITSTTAG